MPSAEYGTSSNKYDQPLRTSRRSVNITCMLPDLILTMAVIQEPYLWEHSITGVSFLALKRLKRSRLLPQPTLSSRRKLSPRLLIFFQVTAVTMIQYLGTENDDTKGPTPVAGQVCGAINLDVLGQEPHRSSCEECNVDFLSNGDAKCGLEDTRGTIFLCSNKNVSA